MDSIDDEVFETWWAYYQCEPFGKHWEQVASIASTVSAVSAMVAATHGTKAESVGVLDFMPGDSLSWIKRKRAKRKGVTSGLAQAMIIKQAFGFR